MKAFYDGLISIFGQKCETTRPIESKKESELLTVIGSNDILQRWAEQEHCEGILNEQLKLLGMFLIPSNNFPNFPNGIYAIFR